MKGSEIDQKVELLKMLGNLAAIGFEMTAIIEDKKRSPWARKNARIALLRTVKATSAIERELR